LTQITVYLTDLVSNGAMDHGGGLFTVSYSGGSLFFHADAYGDAAFTHPEYGIDPPNATSPATFTDGELYLRGVFTSFTLLYHSSLHTGSFEGTIDWTGGSQLNQMYPDPHGYALVGTVAPTGTPVPLGYDLESVGQITFDPALPAEGQTWGQVKDLYR
jgi:hypothetical protein